MSLPTGTVTFLFTDIEGSTRLWEEHPGAMRPALARHDMLLRQAVEQHGGLIFKSMGDAFCAAFATAPDALHAALAAQQALSTEPWLGGADVHVRMALHTGAAEIRDTDYFGPPLNRVARLLAIGHGGQTLLSDVTRGLVRDSLPAGASLADLGEHRLKDLGRPEQIFQLLHPALPADFPPLRSLDNPALPNNLPQQVTSFIGRDREIAALKALLEKARLVTLTGSGGCGKSRLSLQVAADLLDHFPDGAWLVELAPLSDPALVPQAVASALGVREEPGKPLAQTLVEWLKSKQALMVLDNCEHVLEAAARLVDAILHSCPKVKVLVSSREALGIAGESAFRVPPLSLPDPKQPQTPQSLSQYEAALLFIERVVAMKADFVVTNHNAPALASICHRLDGIPLAIELAAARIRSMTVEELEKRLADRFRILTGGSRTALPRQQTLRALIDWSYDLLEESQKSLLCRLAVFAGGWTLEAAEAVCAGEGVEDWEVLDLLTALVDKSLVLAEEQQKGTTRYRLLETVRQYARERLAANEDGDEYRRRHRDFFLALAEEAREKLNGPEQLRWLDALETEHDNLRQAITFCLEDTQQAVADDEREKGLRLGGALSEFWNVRGHLTEGRERLAALLAHPLAQEKTTARALGLSGAGTLAQSQEVYAVARSLYEESLAISRELGDNQGIASCLSGMGMVAAGWGDHASARTLFEQSLEINKDLGDRLGIARSLTGLGNATYYQGDSAAARALHEQSLEIYRELGLRGAVAASLNSLGIVAKDQGDRDLARSLYEQSLTIHRELGNKQGIARTLNNLGIVAKDQGDFAAAQAFSEESTALWREMGNKEAVANSLGGLAAVAFHERNYAAARAFYEEILALCREIGHWWGIATVLYELGGVAQEQDDLTTARSRYEESLSVCQVWEHHSDIASGIADVLKALASLAAKQQKWERSVRLWASAEVLRATGPVSILEREKSARQKAEDRAAYDGEKSAAREALGENAFASAWEEGQAMTRAQAIEYARSES